ncbi:MAG: UDP-3-O-acyl-N-acetylglucosamine deacetylase [Myxococcota bacterium]|nr:UDP-3-O-acyl-N-acetylglucosamine deacetylase [Myxococcota bacterium]
MTHQVIVEGVGLHTGVPVKVTLEASDGPVRLARGAVQATMNELDVVSTLRSTTLDRREGGLRVQTVEHALAAFGGLRVYEGVTIGVDGPEMPLLDGGAAQWCDALKRVGVAPGKPRLRVARRAVIEVGQSRYELVPAEGVDIEVRLEIDDGRIAKKARWTGESDDFESRIATARTFVSHGDVDDLIRSGLARHVPPQAVILLAPEAIHCAGRAFSSDEPARHKLLDLVGDFYAFGGPPLGYVHAFRPGHAANARAIRQARDEGILFEER